MGGYVGWKVSASSQMDREEEERRRNSLSITGYTEVYTKTEVINSG